ncbi:MAG TPA: hypothetical protein VHW46_17735 [Terracidiphilus sp.]|jgi:hypothetical protein|nr:hypothetical protein [Terracidiphilus sp.]
MVTGVSASNPADNSSIAEQSIHKASPAPAPSSAHEDTVTLSSSAQKPATAGDIDHDGDSH